jgi:hypothetical protein
VREEDLYPGVDKDLEDMHRIAGTELPYMWGDLAPKPKTCASCKNGKCERCWTLKNDDLICVCGACWHRRQK